MCANNKNNTTKFSCGKCCEKKSSGGLHTEGSFASFLPQEFITPLRGQDLCHGTYSQMEKKASTRNHINNVH